MCIKCVSPAYKGVFLFWFGRHRTPQNGVKEGSARVTLQVICRKQCHGFAAVVLVDRNGVANGAVWQPLVYV